MKLRSKKSIIVQSEEEKPPKKLLPGFAKITYYLILISILFYIGKFTISSIVYINADGRIYTESFLISPNDSGIIEKIFYSTGDSVKKGDSLISINYKIKKIHGLDEEIQRVKKNIDKENLNINLLNFDNEKLISILKNKKKGGLFVNSPFTIKRLNLQKNIETEKNKLNEINENLKIEKIKIEKIKNLRILESKTLSLDENDEINKLNILKIFHENELKNLKKNYTQILKLDHDYINNLLKSNRINLTQYKKNLENLYQRLIEVEDLKTVTYKKAIIQSPVNGRVKGVFKYRSDHVGTDDSIMELIEESPKTRIKAFFTLEDLKFIHKNKQVQIIFPDRIKSIGIINQINSTSSQLNRALLEEYTPLKTAIYVEIIPTSFKEKKNGSIMIK